ncbi:AarF/ABC1/UbiB kinase family protein [Nocardia sp. 2]|uniref:AarF/ABC1/UbiB kinase family protein n=1 Tax=Nocardia acididurans TaxID=2802282 RepID=A0ABS1M884_9NOCA|nr:AarF/ABC1/UbiB kinase family protein [Nocardia acididurans]MBL1076801.1 AarF/ABC1/UbiB kinase family protein [Nocardia acididurans]
MVNSGSGDDAQWRRWRRRPRSEGQLPTGRIVRGAKLVQLPAAHAGREIAGVGRRVMGQSAAQVRADIEMRTAQHLFEVLGELKGCAAKLGQVLAIYRKALPLGLGEPYGEALSRLQYAAPAMHPAVVHQVLAQEFGAEWRALFREFENRPAAAATIGQVHRGVWSDGTPVAVKVMYPGAREAVAADLRQLRQLSGILGSIFPGADIGALLDTLALCVGTELDYPREAANQREFAQVFADDPEFAVPRVIAHGETVIVGEWLAGTPLSKAMPALGPAERSRLGLLVLRFLKTAYGRSGRLYSDVHPGNFLRLPDGRLGIVDFGACDTYPAQFDTIIAELADALYGGNPQAVVEAMRRNGFLRPGQDFDPVELTAAVAPFLDILLLPEFRLDTDWLRERVDSVTDIRLSNVFRHLTLPPGLVPLARAAVTGLGMMCQLRTVGPVRDEYLAWLPELADVVRRHESAAR